MHALRQPHCDAVAVAEMIDAELAAIQAAARSGEDLAEGGDAWTFADPNSTYRELSYVAPSRTRIIGPNAWKSTGSNAPWRSGRGSA
jgi:hypothetical protein